MNSRPYQVPTLSQRKQQRLGSLPALVAMLSANFAEKTNSCYLYIVMLSTNSKKKRIKDETCCYLRKLISPYGFGWAEDDGVGRYSNEQLIRYYNSFGYMGSPTNSDYHAHFAGQTTLYFWADGRKSSPQTISMIDIDCHGRFYLRKFSAPCAHLVEFASTLG